LFVADNTVMNLYGKRGATYLLVAIFLTVLLAQCGNEEEQASYVYIASGNTFAGTGITMSTPANSISRFTKEGTFVDVIRDYSDANSFAGDTPVAIQNYDADYILVAVENATTVSLRRVERVAKDGSSVSTFLVNSAAFNAANMVIKDLIYAADGGFLVSKGIASPNAVIEKFSASKARITIGPNAFVRAPGGSCATTQTQFSRIALGPSGTIVGAHAAASTNHKVVLVSASGYSVLADCLAAVNGPTANHIPTALLYHSLSGKLFVAFGSSTGPVNDIYSYDISATSLSNPVLVYSNASVVQGVSHLAADAQGTIYVLNANSAFNTVEKFTYDSQLLTLVRVGTTPFLSPSLYTRSISGIVIDP
jgi:hypothetical protein